VNEGLGRKALRPTGTQVNAAHTDAILTGASVALRNGVNMTANVCREAIEGLLEDQGYVEAISGSTSHFESVYNRLRLACAAFES
jgi:hypothetical protein